MTEGPPTSGERSSEDPSRESVISNRVVRLQKEFYGKGPDEAYTYIVGDLVAVVLEGGFTALEKTLIADGRSDTVLRQRATFQEVMGERFIALITTVMERDVWAYVSGSQDDPGVSIESFLLEPVARD